MNLSPRKKFGATHVRAGRILQVKTDHPISKMGDNIHYYKPHHKGNDDWVVCNVGDVAVEVVQVRKNKFLGYSYLSGPAIGTMRYSNKNGELFETESIPLHLLDIPAGENGGAQVGYFERFKDLLREAKDGPLSFAVFEFSVAGYEQGEAFMNAVAGFWTHDCEGVGHLAGVVEARKEKSHMVMHIQPEQHAGDNPMTSFQASLLYEKAKSK